MPKKINFLKTLHFTFCQARKIARAFFNILRNISSLEIFKNQSVKEILFV